MRVAKVTHNEINLTQTNHSLLSHRTNDRLRFNATDGPAKHHGC
jgi:hypothetical protein